MTCGDCTVKHKHPIDEEEKKTEAENDRFDQYSRSTGGTTSTCGAGVEEKHGHPRVYEIFEELAQLHSIKNHDFAAGGDPLGNFKRRASIYALYPGLDLSDPVVVALVDAMKQFDAALWFLSNKHEAKVEGLLGRLKDIAVYAPIAMILEEEKCKKPMTRQEFNEHQLRNS